MKYSLLLSILLLAGRSGASGDSILIAPAFQDISPGQRFTVDIDIDNLPDLHDYQFSLSFNPAVLQAQSITEGALFANTNDAFFLPGSIDNSAGSIALTADGLFGPTGVAGPGTLAVARFTALAPGTSAIDFSPLDDLLLQDSTGNPLLVTPVSGTVDVAATATPEIPAFAMVAIGLFALCMRRVQLTQG